MTLDYYLSSRPRLKWGRYGEGVNDCNYDGDDEFWRDNNGKNDDDLGSANSNDDDDKNQVSIQQNR